MSNKGMKWGTGIDSHPTEKQMKTNRVVMIRLNLILAEYEWGQRLADDRKGKLLPDIKGGIWYDTTNTQMNVVCRRNQRVARDLNLSSFIHVECIHT